MRSKVTSLRRRRVHATRNPDRPTKSDRRSATLKRRPHSTGASTSIEHAGDTIQAAATTTQTRIRPPACAASSQVEKPDPDAEDADQEQRYPAQSRSIRGREDRDHAPDHKAGSEQGPRGRMTGKSVVRRASVYLCRWPGGSPRTNSAHKGIMLFPDIPPVRILIEITSELRIHAS